MHATCTRIGRPARLLARQCQWRWLCVSKVDHTYVYTICTNVHTYKTAHKASDITGIWMPYINRSIYIVVSSQRLSAGKDAQCECFDMFRLKKDVFPKAKLNKNCFALFVQANQISSIRSRIIGQYDPICILYKCSNDFNGFAMMASWRLWVKGSQSFSPQYDMIKYDILTTELTHILRGTVLGLVALSCRSITSAKSPALGRRLPPWFYHALWSDDPRRHVRSSQESAQMKTAQGSVSRNESWCALFIFKSALPGMNWNHVLEKFSLWILVTIRCCDTSTITLSRMIPLDTTKTMIYCEIYIMKYISWNILKQN